MGPAAIGRQLGSPDRAHSDWDSWSPSPQDIGQAEECTREQALYNFLSMSLSDEEICARALREMEWQRVRVELHRAALALTLGQLPDGDQGVEAAHAALFDRCLVDTISALNLMNIVTLLPGEFPGRSASAACVYLGDSNENPSSTSSIEQLDALGGLIREFHKSDIMINGLTILTIDVDDAKQGYALVASHPAIMAAFGEFLVRKYVSEGWRLN